jgi:MOSC domain-containing protein YiiM
MQPRDSVTALTDGGLVGDRYAKVGNRRGAAYQLTLIESEHIEAFARTADRPFTYDMPRRNIVTRDVRLNDLCGKRFRVGGAMLEGIELCQPCGLFAKRAGREVLTYFRNRGGLRTRIIEGGEIRVGDAVMEID